MNIKTSIQTIARAGKLARIAWAARRATRGPEDRRLAAQQVLARLLADARGVPLKIGQLLSNTTDASVFNELAKGVEPRPWPRMKRVLERGLGRPIDHVFSDIDPIGIAASLGQVHRGTLLDGTDVAIKLRYPDIADAVAAEMRLAGLMPGFGPVAKWGFDLAGYKATLKANMDRELNYCGELQRQQRLGQTITVEGLVVPRVYPNLSGGEVLVQSWEPGEHLDVAAAWPCADRARIAQILLHTFFSSLFVAGEVHGDPHVGNVLVRRSRESQPQVVLLDFGCTVEVSRPARLAILKLIVGARRNDATDPLACFAAMGFDADKLEPVADALPAMAQLLVEPFLNDAPFFADHWHLSERINQLLGELRWWFRSAGPSDLLLFVRAFAGLVHQLRMLGSRLPWWTILTDAVGPQLLHEAEVFDPPAPRRATRRVQDFAGVAKLLRIRVLEGESQVVSVSMPAAQVVRLNELIPDDVLPRIVAAGIDLEHIARRACELGLSPQPLFELKTETRHYQVWLE